MSHLEDCNYVHYRVQLNMYRKLLLQEGYYDEIESMSLLYINQDGVTIYPVKEMEEEIDTIFDEMEEVVKEYRT